jgi:Ca2+-binding EF-hand superfamily protein
MNESTNTTDQNLILGFLGRVDRRLRVNEAIEALTLGLWALSALLLLSGLFGIWERPVPRTALLLIYGGALAGFIAWSVARRKGLAVPAGVADARTDSKDALKSSLDFIGLPERTRWMDFQIHRTAELARGLSPTEVAPTVLPKPLYYAFGLAVGLSALLSWNPPWLQELDATAWLPGSESLTADAASEEEVSALPEEEETLEDLDEALEALRQRELEMPESLRDLESAKEALAASRLEMEQLEMDLENLGAELESTPALAELAEAMQSKDAERAAELLRSLAEKLKNAQTSEELQALLESLKDANVKQGDLADLLSKLEKAQGDMSPEALAEMAQALQDAAEQLESMGEQMAADQALEEMGEEMQSLQAAMGQQQAAGQQQPGQQQQAGGQATQSGGMMSSQLQMAQFQGDPSSAVPVDAGPAGDATGPGGGAEPVLGEATTLDVQLEMELLKTEERDEPIPEEIFERLSRQEKSTLNYEALSQRGSYAEDSALGHESIPWLYRSLVKQYFLSIVSIAEDKSESGSTK